MRLTRSGPALHPRALLPLLRHGAGQSCLRHPSRLHGLARARASIRWRCWRRWRRSAAPACMACRPCSSPSSIIPDFAKFDLSSLRTGIMAGQPCPIEVMKRCTTQMHMREITIAYGMTETSPVSFQSSTDDPHRAARLHRRAHPAASRGQDRRCRGPHRAAGRHRRAC